MSDDYVHIRPAGEYRRLREQRCLKWYGDHPCLESHVQRVWWAPWREEAVTRCLNCQTVWRRDPRELL